MMQIYWGFLLFPTVLWLIISLLLPPAKEALDYDLGENRVQAGFPAAFSSDWFLELEKYYNDRAPFRSVLITMNRSLSEMLENPSEVRTCIS